MEKRALRATAVLLLFAAALFAADDPVVGTWKLNLAKSSQLAGASFQSAIAKVEARQGGMKNTSDIVSAEGVRIHSEATVNYDGKDYPVIGDPYADTVAIKRIDAKHADTTWKKGGKVVGTAQNVISPDGKTWAEIIIARGQLGRDVTIVAVYDKQ